MLACGVLVSHARGCQTPPLTQAHLLPGLLSAPTVCLEAHPSPRLMAIGLPQWPCKAFCSSASRGEQFTYLLGAGLEMCLGEGVCSRSRSRPSNRSGAAWYPCVWPCSFGNSQYTDDSTTASLACDYQLALGALISVICLWCGRGPACLLSGGGLTVHICI